MTSLVAVSIHVVSPLCKHVSQAAAERRVNVCACVCVCVQVCTRGCKDKQDGGRERDRCPRIMLYDDHLWRLRKIRPGGDVTRQECEDVIWPDVAASRST